MGVGYSALTFWNRDLFAHTVWKKKRSRQSCLCKCHDDRLNRWQVGLFERISAGYSFQCFDHNANRNCDEVLFRTLFHSTKKSIWEHFLLTVNMSFLSFSWLILTWLSFHNKSVWEIENSKFRLWGKLSCK